MERYFAYGSNMLESRLRGRCPGAAFEAVAKLPDHELVFPRFSSSLECGVASVRTCDGDAVVGVLFSLSDADLRRLDGFEGVHVGAYTRERMEVKTLSGEVVSAYVYVAAKSEHEYEPSSEYLNFLIQGAEEHQLPAQYIERLRSIPILGDDW